MAHAQTKTATNPYPSASSVIPVREEDRRDDHKALGLLGQSHPFGNGGEEQPAEQPADEEPECDAHGQPPGDIHQQPFSQPGGWCHPGQADGDRGVGEREGETIVETGLGGERESGLIVVGRGIRHRLAHLHLGGQNGIGGSQRRREQHRAGHPEAEDGPAQQPDREHRQRHGDGEQAPGGRPPAPPHRPVEGEPCTHQRHDHTHLGEVQRDLGVGLRKRVGQVGDEREHDHPGGEEDHRHGDRQLAQKLGQQRRRQGRHSDAGENGSSAVEFDHAVEPNRSGTLRLQPGFDALEHRTLGRVEGVGMVRGQKGRGLRLVAEGDAGGSRSKPMTLRRSQAEPSCAHSQASPPPGQLRALSLLPSVRTLPSETVIVSTCGK